MATKKRTKDGLVEGLPFDEWLDQYVEEQRRQPVIELGDENWELVNRLDPASTYFGEVLNALMPDVRIPQVETLVRRHLRQVIVEEARIHDQSYRRPNSRQRNESIFTTHLEYGHSRTELASWPGDESWYFSLPNGLTDDQIWAVRERLQNEFNLTSTDSDGGAIYGWHYGESISLYFNGSDERFDDWRLQQVHEAVENPPREVEIAIMDFWLQQCMHLEIVPQQAPFAAAIYDSPFADGDVDYDFADGQTRLGISVWVPGEVHKKDWASWFQNALSNAFPDDLQDLTPEAIIDISWLDPIERIAKATGVFSCGFGSPPREHRFELFVIGQPKDSLNESDQALFDAGESHFLTFPDQPDLVFSMCYGDWDADLKAILSEMYPTSKPKKNPRERVVGGGGTGVSRVKNARGLFQRSRR